MKNLLTIILLFIGFNLFSQSDVIGKDTSFTLFKMDSSLTILSISGSGVASWDIVDWNLNIDTMPVFMLITEIDSVTRCVSCISVTDGSSWNVNYVAGPYIALNVTEEVLYTTTIKGYVCRRNKWSSIVESYLDKDKKVLPKSTIVWQYRMIDDR